MPIRVIIADDHGIFREGIKRVLGHAQDVLLVGEAADGHQALDLVRHTDFDVLVTDLSMPGRGGLEVIRYTHAEKPSARILVLSMHTETEYAVRAIKLGASGYLTKDDAPDQLVQAIRRMVEGRAYISSNVAEQLALGVHGGAQLPHEILSEREFQVFQLLAAGASVAQIGEQLHLSPKTVSSHKSNVLQKLGLANQAEAVRYALRHGLTKPLEP